MGRKWRRSHMFVEPRVWVYLRRGKAAVSILLMITARTTPPEWHTRRIPCISAISVLHLDMCPKQRRLQSQMPSERHLHTARCNPQARRVVSLCKRVRYFTPTVRWWFYPMTHRRVIVGDLLLIAVFILGQERRGPQGCPRFSHLIIRVFAGSRGRGTQYSLRFRICVFPP